MVIIPETIPIAIAPRYHMAEPNAPILLYEGPVELTDAGSAFSSQAKVEMVWLPRPAVKIRVEGYPTPDALSRDDVQVRIPGIPFSQRVRWTSLRASSDGSSFVTGKLEAALPKDLPRCSAVKFHVANFPSCYGKSVRNTERTKMVMGRNEFSVGPWNVVLDRLLDGDGAGPDGTYQLNHVGLISRADGAELDGNELAQIEQTLRLLLSFCRGAWTMPVLLIGLGKDHKELWEWWPVGRIDARDGVGGWFNVRSADGFALCTQLHKRLTDEMWGEPIVLAMHWYVTCNTSRDNVEGAIILQQAAFELLCWTLLVEDRGVLGEDGAQKLPASDKLRLLLSLGGIPLDIPPKLQQLHAVAKGYGWKDGPTALTEIRNALVHANPDKRKRILGKDFGARVEAWQLGQWYLELLLLRVLGFEGSYSNRLSEAEFSGNEVEAVPWSKSP